MGNKSFAIADAGNITFLTKATKAPFLYVDFANNFEVSTKTDLFYAKKKGQNAVTFSKGSEGTAKIETELASMKLFSLITGSTITTGAGVILKREEFTVAESRDFTLAESPTQVLGVATVEPGDRTAEITSFIVENGSVAAQGKAIISSNVVKMYSSDLTAGQILAVYYLYSEASVTNFKVVAKPKSDYFEVYADVVAKFFDTGATTFTQLHLYKAKPKEDLTLSFNTDNASKFTIELTLMPDSTYQDTDGNDGLFDFSQIN